MHSKNYDKIKGYYDRGLWNAAMVQNVVGKATGITAAEAAEIISPDSIKPPD